MSISTFIVLAALSQTTATEPAPAPDPGPAPEPKPEPKADAKSEGGIALPGWLSRIEVSGTAFLLYRYELTEGAKNVNTFDVARMYLRLDAKPVDHVKFRVTLDSPNREATTVVKDGVTTVNKDAARFDVVLKHAYGEVYDLFVPGLSAKLGMHDLPWVPYAEALWGYRFQGSVLVDREGYMSSTDLGLGVGYVTPGKLFEAQVSVINGETWSKPEISKHKDVLGRLTLRPCPDSDSLAGLSFSAVGSVGSYEGGDDKARLRFIGQAAFESKFALLAAEYFWAKDPPRKMVSRHPSLAASTDPLVVAQGWSVSAWLDFGIFGVAEGLRLVGRVDSLDPDIGMGRNQHLREIVGIGYRHNKYVEVLVDGELVQYGDAAQAEADERRVFLHSKVSF